MPAVDDGMGHGNQADGHGALRGDYPGSGYPGAARPSAGGASGVGHAGSYPGQYGAQSQGQGQAQGFAPQGQNFGQPGQTFAQSGQAFAQPGQAGPISGPPVNRATAPPLGNPNGDIQAAPGSPMAGADLGGAGFVQAGPGSHQGGHHGGQLNGSRDSGLQPGGPVAQPGQFGQPGQGWMPMTYRTIRTGGWVVFALIVLAVVIMPLSPLVICAFTLVWSVFARTGTRLDRKVQKHRYERGIESGGFGRTLASAPGALLASALTSIASFILPAIAGIAMLVLTRLDIAGIVPGDLSEQWSVWAAGAAGALVLWVGPGAASLRFGSKFLVSGATRNQLGRLIALAATALLIIIGLMVIQGGANMTWWPLTINPFNYLPGPV